MNSKGQLAHLLYLDSSQGSRAPWSFFFGLFDIWCGLNAHPAWPAVTLGFILWTAYGSGRPISRRVPVLGHFGGVDTVGAVDAPAMSYNIIQVYISRFAAAGAFPEALR